MVWSVIVVLNQLYLFVFGFALLVWKATGNSKKLDSEWHQVFRIRERTLARPKDVC